jgi:hemoglobin
LASDAPWEGGAVSETTVFERAGGMPAFERIVAHFYAHVATDDLLRPMYPEDLEPGKRHLAMFLAQYFGAGPVYSQERGHPRLRMRHVDFPISLEAAARWAALMSDAIVAQEFDGDVEAALLQYVVQATPQMVNRFPDHTHELPTTAVRGRRPPRREN